MKLILVLLVVIFTGCAHPPCTIQGNEVPWKYCDKIIKAQAQMVVDVAEAQAAKAARALREAKDK